MHIADDGSIDEGPEPFAALTPKVGVLLFIVIMSGQAAQSIVFSLIGPMLPAISHVFGPVAGTTDVQLLLALPSLGILLAGLLSGWMIERWGLGRILLTALLTYGIAGSIPAMTDSITIILISRLILGVACVVFSTSCSLLLVLRYRGDSRSRAMGYQGGLGSVVAVFSTLAAGVITHSLGWHLPFAIYGAAAAFVLVCAVAAMHNSKNAVTVLQKNVSAQRNASGGIWSVLTLLWPVYLAAALLFALPMAAASVLPFVLEQRGMAAGLDQSIMLSAFSMFSALGAFIFGAVRQRIGARATLGAGLLLSATGSLMVGVFPSEFISFAGSSLCGLGLGFYVPHLWVVATTLAPHHLRGRAAGLMVSAMYLGGFISPVVLGALSHAFGPSGTYCVLGAACTLALLGMVITKGGILTGAARVPTPLPSR